MKTQKSQILELDCSSFICQAQENIDIKVSFDRKSILNSNSAISSCSRFERYFQQKKERKKVLQLTANVADSVFKAQSSSKYRSFSLINNKRHSSFEKSHEQCHATPADPQKICFNGLEGAKEILMSNIDISINAVSFKQKQVSSSSISVKAGECSEKILPTDNALMEDEKEAYEKMKGWAANKYKLNQSLGKHCLEVQMLLHEAIIKNFKEIITSEELRSILGILLRSFSVSILISLIAKLNMIELSRSKHFKSVIEILDIFFGLGYTEVKEAILLYFNTKDRWEALILSKEGKFITEHFITHLFADNPEKLRLLFDTIESNFIRFSQRNFTTFLVQCYIETTKSKSIISIIKDKMGVLASCRNGVFVILSALKSYKDESLKVLIDRVIELSITFSKDQYSSTIIEYLLKHHIKYTAIKFIKEKSEYFLGRLYL